MQGDEGAVAKATVVERSATSLLEADARVGSVAVDVGVGLAVVGGALTVSNIIGDNNNPDTFSSGISAGDTGLGSISPE